MIRRRGELQEAAPVLKAGEGKRLALPQGTGIQTSRRECCPASAGTSRARRSNPLEEISKLEETYSFLFASTQQWLFTPAVATGGSFHFFPTPRTRLIMPPTGRTYQKASGQRRMWFSASLHEHHKAKNRRVGLELQ